MRIFLGMGTSFSGVTETFVVIINVPQTENIAAPFKGEAVTGVNVSFEDARGPLHRMGAQPGMAEVGIEQPKGLVHLSPNSGGKGRVLLEEPGGKLEGH
jgi:hypothetical protein